ncbi:MAG: hypothetical protein M3323_00095 [Actinomycetota bacterium]|nr:hypothetical protein [Actinomycetota bacterium]
MRARIWGTGVAVAFAAAAVPPASSAPAPAQPAAVVDEIGLASWTFPTGEPGRSRWLFAGAFRGTAAGGGSETFAFAVRGTCREMRERRATSCHGRGTGGTIPASRFRVDPALRSARLDLGARGTRAEVEWRASRRTLPYGYLAGEACQAGTGEGAGMQQVAPATGHLFGRDASPDAVQSALLARGAMVTDCARTLLHQAASGRVLHVVFRH